MSFATLLLESWSTFLDEVEVTFKSTRGKRDAKVVAFLATYVRYLDEHPELLRLDALGYGVLEQNLGPAELREYKAAFTKRLTEVGVIIDDALRLSAGHGIRLLTRTYALTRGLWQSSRPCETPDLSQAESALAPLNAYFGEELREALGEYWRGALALTRSKSCPQRIMMLCPDTRDRRGA